jgi:hypothetical protein
MLHIPIVGGLGNQLFILAFASYNKAILGHDVRLYMDRPRRSNRMHGQNALVDIFWPDKFEIFDSIKPLPKRYRFGEMLRAMKFLRLSKKLVPGKFIEENECVEMTIKNTLHPNESYYCRGYFQTAEFQIHLATIGLFTNLYPREKTQWYTEMVEGLSATSYAAMHVRLGDYLKPSVDRALSLSYYEKSLQMCKNEKVLIFSDEPNKAFDFLKFIAPKKKLVFLHPPMKSKAIESLNLLSNADEIICSDSTFSWWGAILGRKKSLVVVPLDTWIQRELAEVHETKDRLIAV